MAQAQGGLVTRRLSALARAALIPAVLAAGVVLTWSGVYKAADPTGFADLLATHGLISRPWAPPVAWGVLIGEIGVGVACLAATLISPRARVSAAWLVVGVFVVFALYAAALHARPPTRPVPCGCFLQSTPVDDWSSLVLRNAAIAATCALLATAGAWGARAAEEGA